MTKIYVMGAMILSVAACKNREYILVEPVKGKVVSLKDSTPLAGAEIYTDRDAFNAFDTLNTKKDGNFFIEKSAVTNYKDRHLQRAVSYNLFIEKKGYKKVVIDIRNFRKHTGLTAKDTIDLGFIYLDMVRNTVENNTSSHADTNWAGHYTCNFLRLKEEYADLRAWGMIYLDIDENGARFHLDTYAEDIKKKLTIVHKNTKEIQLAAADNKDRVLTLRLDKNKYQLSGNLMAQLVGIKETYELVKE
ncbi:hypothetical protein [Niabella drilacis]|uniref:Lipoprotein n=1 Tax=Niabella drilacis (strain DSM 25811 / CCM 8410 / CCUG 62505 / LMG 26954 / E90) TaxID=1285928 RepID=A0A1G6UT16_NIADE|nr:hypothetical protein [Niabella drilacis]SDD44431.1 hypothetical protein SAMN04487894_10980 [Niabella drilacis]